MLPIQTFHKAEIFFNAAADCMAANIFETLQTQNRASLFLSGGSTPGPAYSCLSTYPIPWQKLDIGLVDERWVPETDKGSNAALIRKTLIREITPKAQFHIMTSRHKTAAKGQTTINSRYRPLMDNAGLAVLGMGLDGHTASWFPESSGLDMALNPHNQQAVQAIMAKPSNVTGTYLERMTLTLGAIKQCKNSLLLIKGRDKLNVLENATSDHPISTLLREIPHQLKILYLDS